MLWECLAMKINKALQSILISTSLLFLAIFLLVYSTPGGSSLPRAESPLCLLGFIPDWSQGRENEVQSIEASAQWHSCEELWGTFLNIGVSAPCPVMMLLSQDLLVRMWWADCKWTEHFKGRLLGSHTHMCTCHLILLRQATVPLKHCDLNRL